MPLSLLTWITFLPSGVSVRRVDAVVPISTFADTGEPRHLVRLCFAKKDETIDAGVAAMSKAKDLAC